MVVVEIVVGFVESSQTVAIVYDRHLLILTTHEIYAYSLSANWNKLGLQKLLLDFCFMGVREVIQGIVRPK